MNTTLYSTFLFYLLSIATTNAQIFQSKGFEKKGMTEYLSFEMDGVVKYWNTGMAQSVNLIHVNTNQNYSTVKFANNPAKYRIRVNIDNGTALCIHPNGRKQYFKAVPTLYSSKDFEKKGVTEFLQTKGKDVYYFTNKSSKKTKLQRIPGSTNQDGQFGVRFPGSKAVYKLTPIPMAMNCIHPNGKYQGFDFYRLSVLAKFIRYNPTLKKLIDN